MALGSLPSEKFVISMLGNVKYDCGITPIIRKFIPNLMKSSYVYSV